MSFTKEETKRFSHRQTVRGVLIFTVDVLLFSVFTAGAVWSNLWYVQLVSSLLMATVIAALFVVGHDAAHDSLTPHKWLNRVIGTICFLPSMHPYSLWVELHNYRHHRWTNLRGKDDVWIPLDPVTVDTGAMKFAKGSHKWGKVYKPVMIGSGKDAEGAAEFDGHAPDIDADPDRYNVEVFEMQRGDALFFHAATLHAAEPNRSSDVRRRALSLRYAGSRATFEPRDYVPSRPEMPELKPGGPLDGDDYPVIWRA